MMDTLAAGAKKLGIELGSRQLEQFEIYYRELVEWNRRVNLTAITTYQEVQIKHFLDALSAVPALGYGADMKVIDVGTGAGVPGVPLRIALPGIRLVLLDSVRKKAAFLSHLKEQLNLDDVKIVVGRAEEVAHQAEYRERFDVVLSRAVAALPVLVELTLPFCRLGGRVIVHKKGDIQSELERAARAIEVLGGRLREVREVELEGLEEGRVLVVIDKEKPTPPAYPRRSGVPVKRPIV